MKQTEKEEVVTVGSHVLVQRLNFKKVYRVSETGTLALGKEEIMMNEIIGKPFWTAYKVVNSQNENHKARSKKRSFSTLVVAEKSESLNDLKDTVTSGIDNRSINDDGRSQKLSKEEILSFKEAGKSGREIVSSLIENNASFTEKTEYSQEKYIKKKEKKYCEYISIHKPTIPALLEIYLRQDASKICSIRMDTLAQILTYSNVQAEGKFLLYDSGTSGLIPAAMLSRIGANTPGNLVYLHSGDHLPQMPIARAMNFPQEQFDRLTIVSIFDFLRTFNSSNSTENENVIKTDTVKIEDNNIKAENEKNTNEVEVTIEKDDCQEKKCDVANSNSTSRKRIADEVFEGPAVKKSRKVLDIERGVELLTNSKADSLVIIAKEHPLNIVKGLLQFVKSSRPFVIYHAHREPLQETYVALKQQNNVTNLKLFSNFLRLYQILPERTHPEITTNDCGGYILTGYTVS